MAVRYLRCQIYLRFRFRFRCLVRGWGSKEGILCLFIFDTFLCHVEILLAQLEADEVAFLLDASDGGRSAAHTVVEHRVALVGVGENEPTNQRDRLLRRMKSLTRVFVEVEHVQHLSLTLWQIENAFELFLVLTLFGFQIVEVSVPVHLVDAVAVDKHLTGISSTDVELKRIGSEKVLHP